MKTFLLIFTIFLAFVGMMSAAVATPGMSVETFEAEPILQRMKRGDCSLSGCESQCRRLKFPGGACVKNKCKCDNF